MSGTRKSRPAFTPFGIVCALLCLLLPPVGLFLAWGTGSIRGIPRVIFSFAAVAVCTVILGQFVHAPSAAVQVIRPVPISAKAVGPEDKSDVIDSLSNMDALLRSQESSESAYAPQVDPEIASMEAMLKESEKQEMLSTIVYTVYGSKAKYYHKAATCDTQKNRRELTLAEALAEKMAACPNCNPPVFNLLDTEKVLGE